MSEWALMAAQNVPWGAQVEDNGVRFTVVRRAPEPGTNNIHLFYRDPETNKLSFYVYKPYTNLWVLEKRMTDLSTAEWAIIEPLLLVVPAHWLMEGHSVTHLDCGGDIEFYRGNDQIRGRCTDCGIHWEWRENRQWVRIP